MLRLCAQKNETMLRALCCMIQIESKQSAANQLTPTDQNIEDSRPMKVKN